MRQTFKKKSTALFCIKPFSLPKKIQNQRSTMPDASAHFSEVSASVQDLINETTASLMKSSTLAASAAPESWQPAPPDANVVCVGPLLQFATIPDEEHAWRELALASCRGARAASGYGDSRINSTQIRLAARDNLKRRHDHDSLARASCQWRPGRGRAY